jgi:hypothetical protein
MTRQEAKGPRAHAPPAAAALALAEEEGAVEGTEGPRGRRCGRLGARGTRLRDAVSGTPHIGEDGVRAGLPRERVGDGLEGGGPSAALDENGCGEEGGRVHARAGRRRARATDDVEVVVLCAERAAEGRRRGEQGG